MRIAYFCFLLALNSICAYGAEVQSKESAAPSVAQFQERASEFNSLISLPDWETTPETVEQAIRGAIEQGNKALDKIGSLKPGDATFENTVRALDTLSFEASAAASRVYLIKETSPDEMMRQKATEMVKVYDEWAVGLDYREDVYRAVKAYADTKPKLEGEDAKLLDETMRDYRRAGLSLDKSKRDQVETLRKELSNLETDFQSNVTQAKETLVFAKDDLDGVPDSFLDQVKNDDNRYEVQANVTWHFVTVMENAKKEATRKRLKTARYNLAKEQNVPLLKKMIGTRARIAELLDYDSWADYQIEPRMAQNAATAREFLVNLNKGLTPKFQAELDAFKKLKAEETGEHDPDLHVWDWRYYSNQLKKKQFQVDTEELRAYFPYQATLHGMFSIFERIFQLKMEKIAPPYRWHDDVELWMVSDARNGEPLGVFYLDMFPRPGKYNHFAKFGIISGKKLPSGKYQRPVVALICNFPAPQEDKPSLLSHNEVETLFHEFGHALHSILTRADHARFSGTSVPRDFVEAPSQMLENWVWEKDVLDSFAADYKDSAKKIPENILQKMEEARLATIGTFYRRQLSFALLDLALHSVQDPKTTIDPVAVSNEIIDDVFLPAPDGTAFVAYFGHLAGYDAGYYGYAWADAISSDMDTVFKKAPGGYFDAEAGMKLREEIYAPGSSRDVNESIRAFLGRARSLEPFLESIGINR